MPRRKLTALQRANVQLERKRLNTERLRIAGGIANNFVSSFATVASTVPGAALLGSIGAVAFLRSILSGSLFSGDLSLPNLTANRGVDTETGGLLEKVFVGTGGGLAPGFGGVAIAMTDLAPVGPSPVITSDEEPEVVPKLSKEAAQARLALDELGIQALRNLDSPKWLQDNPLFIRELAKAAERQALSAPGVGIPGIGAGVMAALEERDNK